MRIPQPRGIQTYPRLVFMTPRTVPFLKDSPLPARTTSLQPTMLSPQLAATASTSTVKSMPSSNPPTVEENVSVRTIVLCFDGTGNMFGEVRCVILLAAVQRLINYLNDQEVVSNPFSRIAPTV